MASPTEVCDHKDCPAKATVAYTQGSLELTFCQHHARELHDRLVEWDRVDPPQERNDVS